LLGHQPEGVRGGLVRPELEGEHQPGEQVAGALRL
jgi:hypothetical protein